MLEEDVEETEDDQLKALWVEVFGDRQRFFNICVKELEKAEAVIEHHMDRTNVVERESITNDEDVHEEVNSVPETQEDKVKVILDLFKDKDLVTLTKYVKVFNQTNCQVLAIAHAKVNAEFNKVFKKLQFKPDDDEEKHVKPFTKPNGDQMSGKGSMVTTCCKIFHIKKFTQTFQESILNLFNMEPVEASEEDSSCASLAASQDFPEHSQSRTGNTLKICNICKFQTRLSEEYENHMVGHPKCLQCGLHFEDEDCLRSHHDAFHATKRCEVCLKDVLGFKFKKHMNAHQIAKGYSKVVSQGKVKASKAKQKSNAKENNEVKEKPLSAYRFFLKTTRVKVRNENPDATPQDMIRLLNNAWRKEKEDGRVKNWEKAAKDAMDDTIVDHVEPDESTDDLGVDKENHVIQKCTICNLMIFNVQNHMRSHEKTDLVAENGETTRQEEVENLLVEEQTSQDEVIEIEETADIHESDKDDSTAHSLGEHPMVEEDSDDDPSKKTPQNDEFKEGDIVLVLRKSLHWPAKILKFSPKVSEVMIFDKARTTDTKAMKYILPFYTDVSICEGRSSV